MASKMKREFENLMERKEFLEDTFITAIEGGINYWFIVTEYNPDKHIAIGEEEEDTETFSDAYIALDTDVIHDGILKLIKLAETGYGDIPPESDVGRLATALRSHYETHGYRHLDLDAGDADIIVQYALYDELVYG